MQLSHTGLSLSASFDEPNIVSAGGLVPVMGLARDAGLGELAQTWLSVPTDKGANAGLKVTSLVAGMAAGADSIDDMAILRHGGMGRLFKACYAPSTLGSFLRSFTFGHVRQLDAVASRFLVNLSERTPLVQAGEGAYTFVDVADTIIEVRGYLKQGLRLRIFRRGGVERTAGHGLHHRDSAGDRRPTPTQGLRRFTLRGCPDSCRCPGHGETAPARPGHRPGAGPSRFGVLRVRHRQRRCQSRRRCFHHRPHGPGHQKGNCGNRPGCLEAHPVHGRGVRRSRGPMDLRR